MSHAGVECPECGKVLKTANPIAPGKKVRCPGCKAIFTMPAPKPAAPVKSAIQARKKTMLAKAPVADEDEAPARRRPRDEDDEDGPRKRRRRDEEDVDDDADRPRKKRRGEDDEEDDRPQKKGKKKSGPSPVLLLSIGGGALAVVLLLVTAFLWPGFLLSGGSSPRPGPGPIAAAPDGVNPLAFLPANSNIVVGVDLEALRKDPTAKDLEKMLADSVQNQPDGKETVEILKDAKSLVLGLVFDGMSPTPNAMVVMQADKTFDKERVRKSLESTGHQSKNHQGKTFYGYGNKPDEFAAAFDDRILLSGKMPEAQFTQALALDGKTVRLSPDMQGTIGGLDKACVWAAIPIEGPFRQKLQEIQPGDLAQLPDLQQALPALQSAKGVTITLEFVNQELAVNVGVQCSSDQNAATLKTAASDFWTKQGSMFLGMAGMFLPPSPDSKALQASLNETAKSLTFTNKGSQAVVSLRVPQATLAKLQDTAKKTMLGGGGGPPTRPPVRPPVRPKPGIPVTPPKNQPIPPITKEVVPPPTNDPIPVKPPPDTTKPTPKPPTPDTRNKERDTLLAALKQREQREIPSFENDVSVKKAALANLELQIKKVRAQMQLLPKTPQAQFQRKQLQAFEQKLEQVDRPAITAQLQQAEQRLQQKRNELDQERQKIMAGS